MKFVVFTLLITALNFQETLTNVEVPTDLIENFDKNVNERVKADYEARAAEVQAFLDKTQQEVDAHVQELEYLSVGKFDIRVQKNCEYDVPELPEVPKEPCEIECLSASYDAQMMAKAVAKITKYTPEDPDIVMGRLGECEIIGEKSVFVKLTVYDACLEGEFRAYYEEYFKTLKEDMLNKGFKYDEVTKTFSHHEKVKTEVQKVESEIVPVEEPQPQN